MNRLIIIGNGFDLAHGLKTKYSDFLLWYINKAVKNSRSFRFEDKLINLNSGGYKLDEFDSLRSFNEALKDNFMSLKIKNCLFERIIRFTSDTNWVDIEYEYYNQIIDLYKSIERHNMGINDGAGKKVIEINNCLSLIKSELVEYLNTLILNTINKTIEQRLHDELITNSSDEVMLLIFNYTNTIESYIKSLNIKKVQVNYIHGQLSNVENPIIFGYGDEMDEYYSKIERLNINEFLINFKSFSYFKTSNYLNLNNFLNRGIFKASLMGHSCGISDRVLLNNIFCHSNCRLIQIYYHQKSKDENDFFEKTQEISRHFPLDQKSRMRNLIAPLPGSVSLS
jgi:hypothetical protein